jgi:hypothetical protein
MGCCSQSLGIQGSGVGPTGWDFSTARLACICVATAVLPILEARTRQPRWRCGETPSAAGQEVRPLRLFDKGCLRPGASFKHPSTGKPLSLQLSSLSLLACLLACLLAWLALTSTGCPGFLGCFSKWQDALFFFGLLCVACVCF